MPTATNATSRQDNAEAVATQIDLSLGRQTILPPLEEEARGGDTSPPPLEPVVRPRFHPIAEIGLGAIGQVVAARDLDIGRRVAIKRLRPDRRSETAFVRFIQEVRTAGQLDHPNIVPIHDIGREEDGNYYIVMKYVDGETLEAVMERLKQGDPKTHREWTFERRIEVFIQILQAVRFAHDHGVLHRDLKPANVMIGNHGEVQLLDWGLAKRKAPSQVSPQAETWIGEESLLSGTNSPLSSRETRVGAILGTPRYMAPEQARGEPVDLRSETYTLCLILYELLSLHHPRDGIEDIEELLVMAGKGYVRDMRTLPVHPAQGRVPRELMWFIMDGLSLDRASRYPDTTHMLELLHRRAVGEFDVRCPLTFAKSVTLKAVRQADRHPMAAWLLVFLPMMGALVTMLALLGVIGALVTALGVVLIA